MSQNTKNFNRCFFGAAVLSALPLVQAQSLIIPQIADGGAWQTTLVLTNTTASAASASLTFYEDTSSGATQNWNLAFLEVNSTQNLSLPGAGTLFLHTPGTASITSQGWAQLTASTGVIAYAIFTQRVPGRQDQDGTAPAATSSSRILVPFDNTSGFVTSIAIANPTTAAESISVGLQPSSGASSQLTPISLPAQGQMAFALPQQFSATSGQSGLLEFYSASGSLSVVALRFNPTGAFTAAPVYQETGPPIIGTSSTSNPQSPASGLCYQFSSGSAASFTVNITNLPAPSVTLSSAINSYEYTLVDSPGSSASLTLGQSTYSSAPPEQINLGATYAPSLNSTIFIVSSLVDVTTGASVTVDIQGSGNLLPNGALPAALPPLSAWALAAPTMVAAVGSNPGTFYTITSITSCGGS